MPDAPPKPSSTMWYVVPVTGVKVTRLCRFVQPAISSLLAISVRLETLLPVYTANNVSKVLPSVSNVTDRFVGAVQQNQSEWPPGLPAWLGSPGSFVANVVSSAYD